MKLGKDSREFVELLNSLRVDYLVVGGHAVAFHGFPRYTGDIDFFVRRSADNASKILEALKRFGFANTGVTPESFLEPGQVLQLGRPPNRIDILTSIDGVSFDEAWAKRLDAEFDGLTVPILSLEDLIANKAASGRPKDLGDLSKLAPNHE